MKVNWRHVAVVTATLALILLLISSKQEVLPPKKPAEPLRKPTWYLVNRATSQTSTAYTELRGAPVSSVLVPIL